MGNHSGTPVTMKTIAQRLGVSTTTVSNAYSKPDRLSDDLRSQIFDLAGELGYCGPSAAGRALRSGKTDVCGFLFGGELAQAFADPYSVIFLAGLSEAVEQYGASVLLLRAPNEAEDELQLLQRAAIDSLVICSSLEKRSGLEQLRQRGVRIVGTQALPDGDWVAINDRKSGRLIGKHLARLGHRDVAVIAPGECSNTIEDFDFTAEDDHNWLRAGTYEGERVRGLQEKLPGARIRIVRSGHYSRESGRRSAAHALDVQDRPTAIVALSDVLALGVLDAARDRGLVPGRDLSVSGFDDLPDAGFFGLTTVRQPIAEKGRQAGRLAMDPSLTERRITLPIELVVRSSTGPAPHN